jgi:NADH-quinone oxidoreductase subunit J
MILVIVYVGAVAVLFLFVVMMLDIDFSELRVGFSRYMPFGLMLAGVLLAELVIAGTAWTLGAGAQGVAAAPLSAAGDVTNTEALGALIYTKYVYIFQAAGMVLLTAMIGAIVLTHRQRTGVRKQSIARQNAVRPEEAVDVVSVPVGEGVKLK